MSPVHACETGSVNVMVAPRPGSLAAVTSPPWAMTQRVCQIGFELAADVLDVGVDRAFERVDIDAAHRVEQLRAREDAARLTRQRGEELSCRR